MFNSFMMSKKHLQSVSLLQVQLHPQVPHLVLLHQQVVLQGLQVLVFQYEQLCIAEQVVIVRVCNLSSECDQVGLGCRSCEYPGAQIQTCWCWRGQWHIIIHQEGKSFIMNGVFLRLHRCNSWVRNFIIIQPLGLLHPSQVPTPSMSP